MILLPAPTRAHFLAIGAAALISVFSPSADAEPFMEQGVNRWGADYQRLPIPSGGPEVCARACLSDSECRAWTFVKAGVTGPSAECRLKSSVPHAKADPCCVSGIAAGASAGVLAGYPSDDPRSSMASTRPKGEGTTSATKPKYKGGRDEELQMPIESEAPEALRAISAPVDLVPPRLKGASR